MIEALLLRSSSVIGGVLGLFAIYVALIITSANHVDVGGLTLPYISDGAREGGSYYVCAICVTIASLFLAIGHVEMHKRLYVMQTAVMNGAGTTVGRWIAITCGLIACICVIVLFCVNTMMDADTHLYSAYGFFVLTLINVITVTILFNKAAGRVEKDTPAHKALVLSRNIKNIAMAVIALTFLIYIPIGLSVMCDWNQDPITKLYTYRDCLEVHQMRAATQHLCVWFMLVFYCTYHLDLAPDTDDTMVLAARDGSKDAQPQLSDLEQLSVVVSNQDSNDRRVTLLEAHTLNNP